MENQPKIHPSSPEQWAEYYKSQRDASDKQLAFVASILPHLLRLGMTDQKKDMYMVCQRIVRRLEYPRDKDPILVEMRKWILKYPELQVGILRGEI